MFAICTANNGIVYFSGIDADGEMLRCYDIIALHKPGRPDDGVEEYYCGEYVDLLIIRAKSKRKYVKIESESDDDDKAKKMNEDKLNKRCLSWARNETISYLNRYFGSMEDTTSTVIMKRSTSIHEGTMFYSMPKTAFINNYYQRTLPGDKLSIPAMWHTSSTKRTYERADFGENLPPNILNYWHGLRPLPPGKTSEGNDVALRYIFKPEINRLKQQAKEQVKMCRQIPNIPRIDVTKPTRVISSGEVIVEAYLRSKNIPFVRQQALITVDYNNMKGGGLTFDFYIAVIKLAIEVDGGQHYKSIEGRGGEPGFVDNLRRDLLKNEWCKQHSTSLLRLSYDDLKYVSEAIDTMINTIRTVPLDHLPCIADEFQEERQRLYQEYTSKFAMSNDQ